jgi:hypothetical protein
MEPEYSLNRALIEPHAHEKGDEHLCVGCALKRDFIEPEWSLNTA